MFAIKNKTLYSDYVINRYPVLAALGYLIAKEDYPEKTAKSLGLGIADAYAAWKYTSWYNWRKGIKYHHEKPEQKPKAEILNFLGEDLAFNKKQGIVIGVYHRQKWQACPPEKFDFKVIDRFNSIRENGFEFFCQKASRLIAEIDITKPFFAYWKKWRDYLRTPEFWEL